MRQLFLATDNLKIKEVAQPLLDDHTVLVQVLYSYVSSQTELSNVIHANPALLSNIPQKIRKILESAHIALSSSVGQILNTELCSLMCSCSGRVIAVGKKVGQIRPGDFVACNGSGYPQHADLLMVPVHAVVPLVSKDDLKVGSLASIGAFVLHSLRRAQLQIGEVVCIYGLGLMGQLALRLAKKAGCIVVGIDILEERITASRAIGADYATTPDDPTFEQEIYALTQGQGVDVTILALTTQDSAVINHAMKLTRKRGKVVVVSNPALHFDRDPFFQKEIDVVAACLRSDWQYTYLQNSMATDYPYSHVRWSQARNMQTFLDFALHQELGIDFAISQEATIETLESTYKKIKSKACVGAVLRYPATNKEDVINALLPSSVMFPKPSIGNYIPASKYKLSVGFITSETTNSPTRTQELLERLKTISTVENYSINQALTIQNIFNTLDALVIVNPTGSSFELIQYALEKKLAVFLDGPLCTKKSDCERLKEIVRMSDIRICINWFRSFLQPIQRISHVVQKRKSPLVIHYRINAAQRQIPMSPLEYVGAAISCTPHIIDLFFTLIMAPPTAVSVESIRSLRNEAFPTDNFSVQLSFSDGSVASLLYSTLGNVELSSERMEIFYDQKAIVLDNLECLYGFGLPSSFTTSYTEGSSGKQSLLFNFFNEISLESYTPLISTDRMMLATYVALIIDELIAQGGGNTLIE